MEQPKTRLIAITGGIGSGKSVVSSLLRVMGLPVYDCDERAKWVMTHDDILRSQLIAFFGAETYNDDSSLNKPYLAAQIFGNAEALQKMNECVHPAVARDLLSQAHSSRLKSNASDKDVVSPFFFESAILFESGFDKLVNPDEVWTVSAPLELRIVRSMKRDNATREKILNRIESQMSQEEKERRADHIIYNDDCHSLIAQVRKLISNIL